MIHHNQTETQQEREISQHLISCANKPVSELLDDLKTTSSGLKSADIDNIIKEHGYNLVVHDKARPWYLQLLGAFHNPFNYILLLLALVSAITGDNNAMIIIVVMVLLSVIIKFTQEYKSSKSAEALKAMVHTTCSVSRISDDGQPV
ncbi:MAG: cation-transporting P-type ATPase, partial [Lentimicrobiaceae bacterium]|nr:cation-transporting P-type ATPase [Lentimicrobiaceae bacterium]